MARLFIDGFEHASRDLWDQSSEPTTGVNASFSSGSAYLGKGYGMVITTGWIGRTIASSHEVWVAFHFKQSDATPGALCAIISLVNGTTTIGCLAINTSGKLCAYRGSTTGTLLATGATTIADDTWYHVEVHYHPDTGSSGDFEVRLNGVTSPSMEIDYSGQTADTYTATDCIKVFGTVYSPYYDDLVVDDAGWIGQSRIQGLAVNANGTTNNWTASTGSNYQCVDEIPPTGTDYVTTNTTGHIDLYKLAALDGTILIKEIRSVQVGVVAQKQGSPTPSQLQAACRTPGTDGDNNFGDSSSVGDAVRSGVIKLWETNPQTLVDWTEADIEELQAGVKAVA